MASTFVDREGDVIAGTFEVFAHGECDLFEGEEGVMGSVLEIETSLITLRRIAVAIQEDEARGPDHRGREIAGIRERHREGVARPVGVANQASLRRVDRIASVDQIPGVFQELDVDRRPVCDEVPGRGNRSRNEKEGLPFIWLFATSFEKQLVLSSGTVEDRDQRVEDARIVGLGSQQNASGLALFDAYLPDERLF